MTEHIVTTLKTPLVERATHPPSQVREKEIVNICMYVHTKERHEREREREKETERQRNTGRCGVKEPVSAAKTAYTGFSTGHRISSQPVCQTQIRKPKRAERSDSELQIFHLCRNLGDTTVPEVVRMARRVRARCPNDVRAREVTTSGAVVVPAQRRPNLC